MGRPTRLPPSSQFVPPPPPPLLLILLRLWLFTSSGASGMVVDPRPRSVTQSLLHTSFHIVFGLPPSLSFSRCLFRHHSPHYVLLFSPHHVTIPFQSFLRYLFRCLRYFRRTSNVFVPDLVRPGHPAHPPQHPHLINLAPPTTTQKKWWCNCG